jgi:peptidoglycan/LPS O-acetylase OafA/YrhL
MASYSPSVPAAGVTLPGQGQGAVARAAEIAGLTALRGVAALLVVFYHLTKVVDPDWATRPALHVVASGYLAVDLFFVLSGFVMTHVYGRDFIVAPTAARYRRFLVARLARIYPLHVFVLALWVALELVRPAPFTDPARSPGALLAHLLLVQDWHVGPVLTWNEPSWSISAEWAAYLAFPVVVRLSRLRHPAWRALAAASLGLLLFGVTRLSPWGPYRMGAIDVAPDFGVARCILEFGLGVLAYRVYADGALARVLGSDAALLITSAAVLAGMQLRVNDLALVPGFVLLILCVASNRGAGVRLLGVRPLRLLGEISYSVYLVHTFLRELVWMATKRLIGRPLWEVTGVPGRVAILAALVAAVLALSACTWRWVEVPMRTRLRKLLGG